jgi:hypothetical protein
MMGRLKSDQAQLLYEFHLRDAVPEDHLVRKILAHNLAGKLTGDLEEESDNHGGALAACAVFFKTEEMLVETGIARCESPTAALPGAQNDTTLGKLSS